MTLECKTMLATCKASHYQGNDAGGAFVDTAYFVRWKNGKELWKDLKYTTPRDCISGYIEPGTNPCWGGETVTVPEVSRAPVFYSTLDCDEIFLRAVMVAAGKCKKLKNGNKIVEEYGLQDAGASHCLLDHMPKVKSTEATKACELRVRTIQEQGSKSCKSEF